MSVKLLKDLNFADKINKGEAITEAGKEMLTNYRAYVYSKPATCGLVNGFVLEASNKYSFDPGLNSIVESVNQFIKENNISWKLASACESISNNNSSYNYIAKLGVGQVEKLLEMNEAEVVSYIKAGSLKNIQYIPEFRQICKEVYKTRITESQAVNYNVANPISYVTVDEDKTYFNVLGKTYSLKDGKVNEAIYTEPKFVKINSLLENFTKNGENIEYTYKSSHGDTCKFSINENGLTFTKGSKINETFGNAAKFGEYCNMVSKVMPMNEKLSFMKVTAAISEVFESIDNVVVMDSVKLMNASNGTICAIIEGKENVNLTVFKSYNAGTYSKNYDYVVEAINNVIKLTGIDLKNLFEERINEDCKKQNPEYEQIKEQLKENKEAQLSIRKQKIAMLAEQYKNDPVRIVLLNKAAKELALLESKTK